MTRLQGTSAQVCCASRSVRPQTEDEKQNGAVGNIILGGIFVHGAAEISCTQFYSVLGIVDPGLYMRKV
jgi:hypothetical protein